MKILALEFSSGQRSVAVLQEAPHSAQQSSSEVIDTGGRAVPTFAMISEALRQTGVDRRQIECLAVGLGPGSYTGIRAAIAVAQGWQLANGTALLGISSVEALAAEAQDQGLTGTIHILIDAQRNEFYLAVYNLQASQRFELEPLRLISLAEAKSLERPGATLIGPDVSCQFPSAKTIFPRAATLARLASQRNDFVPGDKLEPIYLREPAFVKAPAPRITL